MINRTQDDLVRQLFAFLDYTEESDSGRIFHPIQFSCTRVAMIEDLNKCIKALKETIIERD
jgi:hypothetical protein